MDSLFSTVHKTQAAARIVLADLKARPDFEQIRVVPAGDVAGFRLEVKQQKAGKKPANATRTAQATKKSAKKAKAEEPKAPRRGRHADEVEAALKGKLPAAPDFSSPSRERYRGRLKGITDLVKAKDIAGLKALQINPVDSANKIMGRFRDHAVIALEAKA